MIQAGSGQNNRPEQGDMLGARGRRPALPGFVSKGLESAAADSPRGQLAAAKPCVGRRHETELKTPLKETLSCIFYGKENCIKGEVEG